MPNNAEFQEMNEEDFAEWNAHMRKEASAYLEKQGIVSPNVGDWPAFAAAPYFGIWCVESKKTKGKIGWWVFAGDCPTDYVSENGDCHPRSALKVLVSNWKSYIPYMKCGKQPPEGKFGDGSNLAELGDLLETRVSILKGWIADDSIWENL
jgi:hypothetical protein